MCSRAECWAKMVGTPDDFHRVCRDLVERTHMMHMMMCSCVDQVPPSQCIYSIGWMCMFAAVTEMFLGQCKCCLDCCVDLTADMQSVYLKGNCPRYVCILVYCSWKTFGWLKSLHCIFSATSTKMPIEYGYNFKYKYYFIPDLDFERKIQNFCKNQITTFCPVEFCTNIDAVVARSVCPTCLLKSNVI